MTQFTVINHDTEKTFVEDSRSDADDRKTAGITEFDFAPEDIEIAQGAYDSYADATGAKADGGSTEVVEATDADGADSVPEPPDADPLDQLGESLGTDPLSILPGHMVDSIQGQPAVNKRGYAMIAERYGIETSATIVELPWENGEGRCVASATATTEDGKEYSGWATACSKDGDMADQLIELAETRALKRSVAWASGVGIVSYQELSEELQ
jgi:hypothetical protein